MDDSTNLLVPCGAGDGLPQSSFIIYTYTISDVNAIQRDYTYYSPTFQLHRLNWAICYKVIPLPEHHDDVLSLYLSYQGPEQASRMKVEVEFKLVNQNNEAKSFSKDFSSYLDTSSKRRVGYTKFRYWNDVLSPEQGFAVQNSIIIEIHLAATPPQPIIDFQDLSSLEPEKCPTDSTEIPEEQTVEKMLKQISTCHLGTFCTSDRGEHLLSSGIGADFEFLVGEEEDVKSFRANSVLLARASPVFERMFFGEMPSPSPVRVPDIRPEAFYKLLKFAYGCKLNMKRWDEAAELYAVANKYLMQDLENFCLTFLWPKDENNVWSVLKMAEYYSIPKLEVAALRVVVKKPEEIVQHRLFADLTPHGLLSIVRVDQLVLTSELMLFKAMLRWAKAECERKGLPSDGASMRLVLGEAFYYIRFLAMPLEEFVQDPVLSGVLSQSEQLQCLLTIISPGVHPPSPTVCALRGKRGGCYEQNGQGMRA